MSQFLTKVRDGFKPVKPSTSVRNLPTSSGIDHPVSMNEADIRNSLNKVNGNGDNTLTNNKDSKADFGRFYGSNPKGSSIDVTSTSSKQSGGTTLTSTSEKLVYFILIS